MKTVLLTGAAGFIGSHLTERLLADGQRVIGFDNFDPFYPRPMKENNLAVARKHPAFALIEGDIRSTIDEIEQTLAPIVGAPGGTGSVDVIVHLAAKAGVRPSIEDPIGYQDTNVKGTQNMLEIARKYGVKKFVFASSSSVYGVNPDVPWSEDHEGLRPISPYASTKVSGELLGHVYSHLYGIRFVGLRFFTVYGPRQRPDLAIHKFARLILDGKPIPFFGDGSTRRDYTFVDDIVAGIIGSMDHTGSEFEVVNLGNNQTVSLAELVETLESVLDRKAALERLPAQPGDVPQTWADVSKAGTLFGYKPKTALKDGLLKFADWLSANR